MQNLPDFSSYCPFFDKLIKGLDDDTSAVIESTANWYWLYDLLTENGIPTAISNSAKTKAIASAIIKNDKLDSYMPAQLLRADLLATVHVSSKKTRQLKELLRHRNKLDRDSVRMKNRIHNIIAKNNMNITVNDLFGVKGLEFLSQAQLLQNQHQQVDTYLTFYFQLKECCDEFTEKIKYYVNTNKMGQLLMTN